MTDKKQAATKNKGGRPSSYSPEIVETICIRLGLGESLKKICQDEGMPSQSMVYSWLLKHAEFQEMYTRAREDQADTLADQIIAIADQHPETVPIYDKEGQLIEVKVDSALIAWQKNRIEARKWTAAKLKPRKYGERQILAGDAENPVEVKQQSETLDVFMQNLMLIKQTGGKK